MLGTTAEREKAYIKEKWKAAEKKNLTGAKGQDVIITVEIALQLDL